MTTAATRGLGDPAALVELPADPGELHEVFVERGWSDGLPVIPPTEQRVEAMLAYTDRDRHEVVGVLPPRNGVATIEAIAINAVLAGCEPRALPLLLAAVQGIVQPQFNLSGINATTHPCAVLVLVNGPIGRELGVHGGPGCYGPGFRANATIGRAVRLLLLNIAGASPGLGDRATQGTPAKFALCLAENEEASPWAPFHTTRGFEPEDSTVTVAASEGPHNIQEHGSNTALGVLQTVVGALGQAGSNNILSRGEPLLALGPEHAATIADEGWTREGIQQYVHEHARYPATRLSPEFLESVNVRIEPEFGHRSVPSGRAAPDRQRAGAPAALRRGRTGQALLVAADIRAADEPRHDADRRPLRSPRGQRRGPAQLAGCCWPYRDGEGARIHSRLAPRRDLGRVCPLVSRRIGRAEQVRHVCAWRCRGVKGLAPIWWGAWGALPPTEKTSGAGGWGAARSARSSVALGAPERPRG